MKHLFTIRGRYSRSEFLKASLVVIAPLIVFGALNLATGDHLVEVLLTISYLIAIVLQPIQSAKRLHDLNARAGWALFILIPIVYAVMLIGLATLRGTRGKNRFGPDSLAVAVAQSPTAADNHGAPWGQLQ